ncbi:nitrite reductase/ring-hydroxylating ferredoxin subunit [Kribbella sp. VKM Ac-2569]|uniref:Rieske (2Fe-2S) protein n=1 Tax=Kribbella sp. VKM Ac-2569 TaxID=2512220 RepID=UPI00102C9474|nr:Rieske (2Fe-2S) protein [Kribbella sp. VKM Ac-2569]RZT16982.1 nitrite reductase/ring-hydroxylating ferredoxin subunit [Kribbella sp. VKM Ac-2569]
MSDDTMAPATTPQQAKAADGLRDRRTVLRCAAMVALAGASAPILAACGGSDDASGGGTTPSASGSSSAPSASSSASSSAPSSSAPAGGGSVLGPVSDVPVGGGKVFTDAKVVVTQPTAGQYKGFSAVCTHQGNPIGSVENGQIVCPFHQSHFSITDGSPVSGPAQTALPAVNVKVEGGNIVESA